MTESSTYIVVRKNANEFSYGEPIYAGSDREFALSLKSSVFVVFEFNIQGRYVRIYEDNGK